MNKNGNDIHDGENFLNQNDADEKAQPDKVTMIQIVIDKDGNLGIGGLAVNDKAMAYGLLEAAKDIIRDMHQPKLIKPNGGLVNHLRGRYKQ